MNRSTTIVIKYPSEEEAERAASFYGIDKASAPGTKTITIEPTNVRFRRHWSNSGTFSQISAWWEKYPDVAAEADGWNPREKGLGYKHKLPIKCPKCGLRRSVVLKDRIRGFSTVMPDKAVECTGCSGFRVHVGINCLESRFPEIAKFADFNPKEIAFNSSKIQRFNCNRCGGKFSGKVRDLVPVFNSMDRPCCKRDAIEKRKAVENAAVRSAKTWMEKYGCKKPKPGKDLASLFPDIAKEAHGWDPSTVTKGARVDREWKCQNGHVYTMRVAHRTCVDKKLGKPHGCSACSLSGVTPGVNDFLTKQPALASLMLGVDPSTIGEYHQKRVAWNWPCGHQCKMSPGYRVVYNVGPSRVCPNCLGGGGFKGSRPGFFYFLKRPGQTQFGITFSVKQRMKVHARFGWNLVESFGSLFGEDVRKLEADVKQALRAKGIPTGDDAFRDPFPGSTEAFQDVDLDASSVCEMLAKLGIPVPEFVSANQKPVKRNTGKSK